MSTGVLSVLAVAVAVDSFQKCYETSTREICFFYDEVKSGESNSTCKGSGRTLPIITDNETDAVFRQFIGEYNANVLTTAGNSSESRRINSTWIALRSRNSSEGAAWLWGNGRRSGEWSLIYNAAHGELTPHCIQRPGRTGRLSWPVGQLLGAL